MLKRPVQELNGRILFQLQLILDSAAPIDQKRNVQWEVGIDVDPFDNLRLVVLEELEIGLFQICDELAFVVLYGKQNIDALNVDLDLLSRGEGLAGKNDRQKQSHQEKSEMFHKAPNYSIARKAGSSMTGIPSSRALSNFDPGSRPART
jgi:hypothetical protein